jgi:Protein of unknown function (DUF1236)
MKQILLNTAAAAALVIGMSAAYAQSGSGTMAPPQGASGGASGGAGGAVDAPPPSAGGGASGGASTKSPMGGADAGTGASGGMNKQAPTAQDQKAPSPSGSSAQGEMKDKAGKSAEGASDKAGKSAEGASDKAGKSAEGGKASATKEGRAAASANLSSEQKSEIKSTLGKSGGDRVKVDFDVNVGVVLPSHIHTHVHPLPASIVTLVPAYRGYSYIVLADGRIVIIEPASYEIVTIITV